MSQDTPGGTDKHKGQEQDGHDAADFLQPVHGLPWRLKQQMEEQSRQCIKQEKKSQQPFRHPVFIIRFHLITPNHIS